MMGGLTYKACLTPIRLLMKSVVVLAACSGNCMTSLIMLYRAAVGMRKNRDLTTAPPIRAAYGIFNRICSR